MTHFIVALAMYARRIARAALISALLAVVVFMALSTSTTFAAQSTDTMMAPGTALAAQWYPIGFNISPTAGTDAGFPTNWTREPPNTRVRTKNGYGNILLNLTDNVDGGICVKLLAARDGSQLGRACWEAGEYGPPKTLATGVLANTRFTVWATKRHSQPTNNYWAGSIYY
jgi:hypothetical protein